LNSTLTASLKLRYWFNLPFYLQIHGSKTDNMKRSLLYLFCFAALFGSAQVITHGPIVGGVTDTSCNIFVRTSSATGFTILLSNTVPFGSIVASAAGATNAAIDTTAIVHISGLTQNTQYSMRLTINGSPISVPTQFTTLYSPDSVGHQVFLTGACINGLTDVDSAIFTQAGTENARAFINLGNWGYPDVTSCADIYLSNPPTSWAKTYSNVQNLYKQRYSSSNSANFIRSLGLDFVYDDHDYMNEKTGQSLVLNYQDNPFTGIFGAPTTNSQPAAARLNSLQGYETYFPAYTLPDSSTGLYHSFRSGNAEFFVLDTRSARGYQLLTVDTIDGSTAHWGYVHDTSSHILGNEQMAWLQNALGQSTATWKFIVSSVPFNMGMRLPLDSLINRGSGNVPYWNPSILCIPFTLVSHAYSSTNHFADMWAGFKADGDSLLNYVFSNNISNVFVVSGNSGTVGLDDGINSGLPELMSGNMKITNTEDALDCQNFMGFNLWDLGGSGLCQQTNLNSTYGKIEVFNNDSIRLSAVDQTGAEVTGANFYAGTSYKYNPAYTPNRIPMAVADNVTINENDSSALINVLANDSDLNGDALFVNLQSGPNHGSATINSNNTFTYVPDTGYYGVDTFHYLACDHSNTACANCASAQVIVNITRVTAVNEVQNTISFNIYPNPAEDIVFIDASNNSTPLVFQLLNTLGQKLNELSFIGNTTIDISKYAAGNYLYNILDKNHQMLKVGKITIFR
jgi:phosphodiesterase/alkaline phosphatase D-like protein